MIKLSEKAKIIIAVMAVIAVAAGAVAVTALSASANDVQNNLNANGSQGGAIATASDKTQIAMPEIDSGGQDQYIGDVLPYIQVVNTPYNLFDNIIDMTVVGTDFAGNTMPESDVTIADVNAFDVTRAGNYTVTLTIRDEYLDQYEWAGDPSSASITVTYTVSQRLIRGSTSMNYDNTQNKEIEYASGITINDVLSRLSFAPVDQDENIDGGQVGKYTLKYGVFLDSNYTTQATDADLRPGAKYYVKATDVLSVGGDDNTYLNYRLPNSGESSDFSNITTSFSFAAPSLPRPVVTSNYYTFHAAEIGFPADKIVSPNVTVSVNGRNITAPYLGFAYKISQWFYGLDKDNWTESVENEGHDRGSNWTVTVNGREVDPNTYEMIDAGTYNVSIAPKGEYKFKGDDDHNYVFTIKPFILGLANVQWIDRHHVYSGEPISLGEGDYEVVGLFGDDALTLQFERTVSVTENGVTTTVVADSAPINAGRYMYRVKAISESECSKNYALPTINADGGGYITNTEIVEGTARGKFIIYKKTLDDFKTNGPLISGTFNGQSQDVGLYDYLYPLGLVDRKQNDDGTESFIRYIKKLDIEDIKRSYPSEWNLGSDIYTNDASFVMKPEATNDEFFRFTYAGSYTVVFTMEPGFRENHCWSGKSDDPDSPLNEQYVWTDFALIGRAEIDPLFTPTNILTTDQGFDIEALIKEKFNGLGTDADPVYSLRYGKDGQTGTSATPLHGTSGNYLEGRYYVTIELDSALYPSVYFKAPQGSEYTVSGNTATVYYEVTSSTVSISCDVKPSYTFGDNFDAAFKVVTVTTNHVDGVTYNNTAITYYDDKNNPITDANLLVNGSPRNAGKYYVVITVDYTVTGENGSEDLVWTSQRYSLTVNKRQLTVSWEIEGGLNSFTYDGNPRDVSVTVGNTLSQAQDVTAVLNNATVTNAGTHNFSVDDSCLEGTEAANYTVAGVTNATFTVTIARKSITVTANQLDDVTYGGNINEADLTFSISFNIDEESSISVAVYNSLGALLTNYVKPNRGSYTVVPVWGDAPNTMPSLTNGKYSVEQGNYVFEMQATTFEVASQSINVTLKTDGSGVYGDAADLWALIDSVTSGKDTMSVDELKLIAYITATKGSVVITADKDGVTVSGGTYAGVGSYALDVKPDNEDYRITVTNSASYSITPRPVTYVTKEVTDHRYGNYYDGSYSEIELAPGSSLMPGDTLNTRCRVLSISEENGRFSTHEITNSLDKQAVGTYYQIIMINSFSGVEWGVKDGGYYYEKTVGNYRVTAVASRFIILPRLLTLTFKDAELTYGDGIDLWKRQSNFSDTDERYYSTFDYVTASGLRFDSSNPTDKTLNDSLNDVIMLSLFVNGKSYNPESDKINAATYGFKATVKNGNYKLVDGSNEVDETVKGQFVVSKKPITVNTTASVNSIVYGSAFDVSALGISVVTANGIVDGDTVSDLGIMLSIFNGESNVTEDMQAQNVGSNYIVDITSSSNGNYQITVQNKAKIAITKRPAKVTANDVLGHVYGNAFEGNFGFTPEAKNGDRGFLNDAHWQALNITASVSGSVASLAVKEGGYPITLTIGNTADIVNSNYEITLVNGTLEIVKREITITASSVEHIYGKDLSENELRFDVTMTDGSASAAIVNKADEASLGISLKIYDGANPVANDDVAALTAGQYDLIVSYTENSNYDVTVVNAKFSVVTLKLTIRYIDGIGSIYGNKITDEDLKKAYELVDGTLLEGDSLIVTAVNSNDANISIFADRAPVGRYIVKVEGPNDNYEIEYENGYEGGITGTYRINARPVYIAAKGVTHVYGNPLGEKELSYEMASTSDWDVLEEDKDKLNVTIQILLKSGEFAAADDIKELDVGSYEIYLTCGDTPNYILNAYQGGKFEVTARDVTVTPDAVLNHVYGEALGTLTYNGEGFVKNEHLTALGITAKVYDGETPVENADISELHAKTYKIKLEYPAENKNDNYNVTLATADFVVEARKITVTANNITHTYGEQLGDKLDGAYSVKLTEGTGNAIVNGDLTSLSITVSIRDVANSDVNTLAVKDGGYVIDVNYNESNTDYDVSVVTGTFTVDKRVVTITFTADGGSSVYGEAIDLDSGVYTHSDNLVNVNGIKDVITVSSSATRMSNVGEYPVTITVINNNYDVSYNGATTGKYNITTRSITVTPSSFTHTYGDALGSKLTESGAYDVTVSNGTGSAIVDGDLTKLAIALAVYDGANKVNDADVAKLAVKTGGYTVKASYTSNGNYVVDVEAEGTFTVTKRDITIEFVEGSSDYGTAITESDLDALRKIVEGSLVNTDTLAVSAMQGTHSLTENNAPAGTYVVTVEASDNYNVTYKEGSSGSYVVNKKVITVSLKQASIQYREDGSDYHKGEYGATLNAEAVLDGVVEGDSLTLGGGFTVAYAQNGSNATPNKAGKYSVTVTITNSNYTFANGQTLTNEATLEYEITKKVFDASDLVWNETMKVLEGSDAITTLYVNYIPNYIDAIMEIVPYDESTDGVYKLTAGNTKPISMSKNGDRDTANSYFFENGMLYITAQGRARYGARFKLTAAASNNYVIDGANQDGIVEVVCFIVDNEVKISITTQNWQYGDEAIDPVVTVNGQNPIYGLTYQYARLTANEAEMAKLLAEKEQLGSNGFELSRFDGLYDDLSNDKPSFDVGYYLICVTYDGMKGSQDSNGQENIEIVTVTICDFIEVSKKQLRIPLTIKEVTFNGDYQWGDVDFNMTLEDGSVMNIREFVTTSVEGNSLREINVGTYTIELFIKASEDNFYVNHYAWADDMLTDGKVIVTWEIVKDSNNNDDERYFEVGDIDQVTYGNDVVKSDPTLKSGIKSGYGNAFTWYFAPKGTSLNATEIPKWTLWDATSKPKQSGEYFAKAVLSDVANNGKNFTDKIAYGEFSIDKATLTLTLSGSIEYGNKATQADCGYVASGFEYGEDKSAEPIIKSVGDGIYYYLVDESDDRITDVSKLAVDTYNLTARLDGKYVRGLEADDYYIVLANEYGKFEVTAKAITVSIGDANGQFGIEPDLRNVTVTYTGVDSVEVIAGVKALLKTTATNTSDCGAYAIVCENYVNKNFDIKYDQGEYTVEKRQVKVTLNNGGGTYNKTETFVPVTIASVLDSDGKVFVNVQYNQTSYVITIGDSVYTITVVYNGTSNSGQNYANSEAYPTFAGDYTAIVAGSGSSNFEIVETVSAQFNVDKFEVDKDMITVQEIVFTGKPLSPDISVKAEADFTTAVFTPQEHEDFIEARDDYEITLKLNDFNNYKWSDSVNEYAKVTFVILKAGIYATPTGNIVYGTAFNQSTVEWRFVYADTINGAAVPEDVINDITIGSVEFVFDRDIDRSRPAAGTYKITCQVDASGRIVGLTHSNFNITLMPNDSDKYGDYVVSPKAITIVAGSSSSIYSQNPADYLSNEFTLDTTIDGNALVDGESLLNVISKYVPKFRTTVTADSKVGNYAVTADVEADNYAVSVTDGTHEILPIEVKLILKATNGSYHGTQVTYGVAEITATNIENYDFSSFDRGNLSYYFTGIDGTTYGNNVLPTDAGKYVVTVTAINNVNGNFIIDPDVAVVTATFEIAKMVIDENSISIASKVYNGREQAHGLANGDGYTVSSQTFKNVGYHDVTLSLTNADNYEWSEHKQALTITKTFQITKAKLQLQPAGELTYGESFESKAATYGFKLIGLLGDDENADNRDVVSGTVKYLLANGIDGTKLSVKDGGYAMTADVSELTSDNYAVEVIEGVLTVNKREITIKPVSSESVYGEPVVVSQAFTFERGSSFADGDDATVIEYLASTTANAQSNAGEYAVTIVLAKNDNYKITTVEGKHVIKKAKVGVSIRPINGTYGDENNRGIEFMSVVLIKSDGTTEPINGLEFQVKYEGIANDKSTYSGNNVPTKAGIYTATVIGVESGNYELDASYGDRNTVVEIFKRQIDAGKITATSAAYTGKAIVPHIEDSLYNVNGEEIYNVLFSGSLIYVGTYDLTLSLVDTFNYAWVDNLNRTTTIEFKIVKADISLVDKDNPNAPADAVKVVISDWTFDEQASKPQAAVSSGDQNIVFEYATSENGSYTTEVPKDAGEYWVRATVAASDNYNAFVSKATKFVIAKKVVNLPVASNLSENSVYTGSMLSLVIDGFDDHIMSLTLDKDMYRTDVSGKLNLLTLNAGTYTATFRLRNNGNYAWASDEEIVDGAVVVTWTIDRQIIKRLPDATSKMLVNGEDIVFIPEGFNSGIMTIENNVRAHEGNFSAIVTLKDTDNYAWEGTDSASIAVNFELTGTNTAFIAAICVVSGLCVGLAVMALILTLVNRRKKRKEAEAIDARSRADGWEDK